MIPTVPTTSSFGTPYTANSPNLLNAGNNYGYLGYDPSQWTAPTMPMPATPKPGPDIGGLAGLGLTGALGYKMLFGGPAAAATTATAAAPVAAAAGSIPTASALTPALGLGGAAGAGEMAGAGLGAAGAGEAAGLGAAGAGEAGLGAAAGGLSLGTGAMSGGVGLLGGMLGSGLEQSIFPKSGKAGSVLGGAAGGAAAGAMVGGPWGALIGGIGGALSSLFKDGGRVENMTPKQVAHKAVHALRTNAPGRENEKAAALLGAHIGHLMKMRAAMAGAGPAPMVARSPVPMGGMPQGLPVPMALGGAPGHSFSGPVKGPGNGRADMIPAMLSNDEHVMTAGEVAKLGGGSSDAGHQIMSRFRANLRSASPDRAVGMLPTMKV